jgi:hypothetical protein
MKLLDIQQLFNATFDIKSLKSKAEIGLEGYLNNHQFLREKFGYFDFDVFRDEYHHFSIFINTTKVPFFRIMYVIYVKGSNTAKFRYDMTFNADGEIVNEEFDLYIK